MWKCKSHTRFILLIIHQVIKCYSLEAMIFQTGSGCGGSQEIQIKKFMPGQETQIRLASCSMLKLNNIDHLQAITGKF